MAIRGNTTAGAQMAHAVSMHMSADQSNAPGGTDTKSAAIAAVVKANHKVDGTQTATYNTSVDQLRQGMAAAP